MINSHDALKFVSRWQGRGNEKSETQAFWLTLLHDVLHIPDPYSYIAFEKEIRLSYDTARRQQRGFIDAFIQARGILIEQKSLGVDLEAPRGKNELSALQQARRYAEALPKSLQPNYIVTCNFEQFLIYNEEDKVAPPVRLALADLATQPHALDFLLPDAAVAQRRQEAVSLEAGVLVGRLYDALLAAYHDPTNPDSLHSLNVLMVRLVFCLYAEDAALFDPHNCCAFGDYLRALPVEHQAQALKRLFAVLDTPLDKRDPYLEPSLAAFPYCNGGLFRDRALEIPLFTPEISHLLIDEASDGFDWTPISPTIFGAVFESTLNPATRRAGGMHFTSVANIHRLIDPLFLNGLREQWEALRTECRTLKNARQRETRLHDFQQHLASLRFLDPACGSGNFLTETYLSLRTLENEVIQERFHGQSFLSDGFEDPILVSIDQCYGLEVNDFAADVAATALWIAELQMKRETEQLIRITLPYLPLKTYQHIHCTSALTTDWAALCPPSDTTYVIGNPPFVGYTYQSAAQKSEMQRIFVDPRGRVEKMAGKMDYVSAWYRRAAAYLQGTAVRAAFVSTNSITQGDQVAALWRPLVERYGLHIDFAYRTFRWDSESTSKAHVHCVIIGFSAAPNPAPHLLFDLDPADPARLTVTPAAHINAYLMDAPDVFVESRSTPLCPVPAMCNGNRPTDGGHLLLSAEEREALLTAYPALRPYIKTFLGSEEFINRKARYCLWLVEADPQVLKQCPPVMRRIEQVREMRLASSKAATRESAATPTIFQEIRQPKTDYLLVPRVSSERRPYIPIGFLDANVISSDANLMIPLATPYHFGVLTSRVHMAWMRTVCGRLKSDYRYSGLIVYNNFPWPEASEEERARIAEAAEGILEARRQYPEASMAALYDPLTMPPALQRAHRANDRAVLAAYHLAPDTPEPALVAHLFARYAALTASRQDGSTLCQ